MSRRSPRSSFGWMRGSRAVATALIMVVVASACSVDEQAQVCPVTNPARFEQWLAEQPIAPEPASEPGAAQITVESPRRQVLVVAQQIPAGFAVQELVENPTAHLTARALHVDLMCGTSITSIADLQRLQGSATSVEIPPGTFLDLRQFRPASG